MMSHKSRSHSGQGGHAAGFQCMKCRQFVSNDAMMGTRHRNHCPYCLWSKHLDDEPGDRRCACHQAMEPIGIEVRRDGEWAIVHRCTGCGLIKCNRIAGDDRETALLALALRPLANPAFPIDAMRS